MTNNLKAKISNICKISKIPNSLPYSISTSLHVSIFEAKLKNYKGLLLPAAPGGLSYTLLILQIRIVTTIIEIKNEPPDVSYTRTLYPYFVKISLMNLHIHLASQLPTSTCLQGSTYEVKKNTPRGLPLPAALGEKSNTLPK